ncbi:hypothetical protein [Bartonella sp. B1099]|uniref:hypothetical protein n=1 Tax=Bartonella sp. B1099 TaxID=2911422 RepID=UPI0020C55D1E|nr:hypothetical protein [Bartonella sp. B1099]
MEYIKVGLSSLIILFFLVWWCGLYGMEDKKLDDRLWGEKFILWGHKVRGRKVLCFINDKKMPVLNQALKGGNCWC